MEKNEVWLSIVDYASLKRCSISTVRRSIKASKVRYRKDQGKFFIFVDPDKLEKDDKSQQNLQMERDVLKNKLRKLEEENNDLRMLVHLYEGSDPPLRSSDLSP